MALTKLLVKAEFGITTQLLELTDLIAADYNTEHGLTLSNIKGMFKVTGVLAGVVYENDGFATDDYSDPDVDGSVPTWVKSGISLPLDSDDIVLQDVYTIEYKITSDGTGDTTFTFSKVYTHEYESPTAVIDYSINLPKSYATITDNTVYNVLIDSTYYAPASLSSRVMNITWPSGSGQGPTVTANSSVVLGPNLWTKDYLLTLSVPVTYTLPAETDLTVDVTDVISGTSAMPIEINDCKCTVEVCLNLLTNQYEQAKEYNLPEAQLLKKNLDDIIMYYDMYQLALDTSKDTTYACTMLRELMEKNGCEAQADTSTTREIIPTTSTSSQKQEFIVTEVAGQTEFDLNFVLTTNSLVLVDGVALINSQIDSDSFGTTTLTILATALLGQTVIVLENI